MLGASKELRLFGLDLGAAGQGFRALLTQFFWASDSPIRQRLDEPVEIYSLTPGSTAQVYSRRVYRAAIAKAEDDSQQGYQAQAQAQAIELPDAQVLHRSMTLPAALTASLDDAVRMEVRTFSPFREDDTAYGWRIRERSPEALTLDVAIASRTAAFRMLRELQSQTGGEHDDEHTDVHSHEIWTFVAGPDAPIVLLGFGEEARNQRYLSRLSSLARVATAILLGLFLAPIATGLVFSLRADALDEELARLRAEVADELSMREELGTVRQLGAQISAALNAQADFQKELGVLTEQLPDDAYAQRIQLRGDEMTVSGLADDAADLMTRLSEYPGYAEVTNRGGFRRDRSGRERFNFEISFAPVAGGETP
jgi:general secretion pathway protein L